MPSKHFYNTKFTYEKNYSNPPKTNKKLKYTGEPQIDLMGHKVYAPIGIAAGTVLNSDYVKAAVAGGASVITSKTLRSLERECLPYPNCVYIKPGSIIEPNGTVIAQKERTDTMTNSFGMPSASPDFWMQDVRIAQEYIDANPGHLMIVSVVGTPFEGVQDPVEQLAMNYAECAVMAQMAGGKVIELNFSCPNVRKDLGLIYQDASLTSEIIRMTRHGIGKDIPLLIKVAYWQEEYVMQKVVDAALNAGASGFVGINTIPMNVTDEFGAPALPGRLSSGVCGKGIAPYAIKWLDSMVEFREKTNAKFIIGSSGGITCHDEFDDRLRSGADFALATTSSMHNPGIFADYHYSKGNIQRTR
ncbi:MAG: hypothetical protein FWG80_00510 [Alphaproteobacteria bacterium]|nr:hypothetical protein [Alphaproteobacteria bacterium]